MCGVRLCVCGVCVVVFVWCFLWSGFVVFECTVCVKCVCSVRCGCGLCVVFVCLCVCVWCVVCEVCV